jgi:hypothetical protein
MVARTDYTEVKQLLDALAQTPAEVARLLQDVPPDRVRIRPSAEEFSAVESVCHLRDIEIEGYTTRINRILNETNPALRDVDGARLALERDYNSQEIAEALEFFKVARERNVKLLLAVDQTGMNRKGSLEGVGEVTLIGLLGMMNEHDQGHLDDLQRLARLAKLSVD